MPDQVPDEGWPALPTETEIYILPNGEIIIADLPAELAASLQRVALTSPQVSEDRVIPVDPASEAQSHHVTD